MKQLTSISMVIVLLLSLCLCACSVQPDTPSYSEPEISEAAISEIESISLPVSSIPEPEEPETALYDVVRVVDGDTFIIDYNGTEERVRLLLVDTPESVHPDAERNVPYGKVASEFTTNYLDGKQVSLEFDVQERDQYGRLLAYVYVGDVMLKELLLSEGHATVSVYQPNVKYVDQFRELEAQAKAAKVGIWTEEMFSEPVVSSTAPVEQPVEQPVIEEPIATPIAGAYIANANTGKFHYASCSSVGQMNESNKVPYSSRDAAAGDGYIPCKRCKP